MKIWTLINFCLILLFAAGCDQKLKEHPVPLSVKRELAKQNNPQNKAKEISGTITATGISPESIPKTARLFIFARPEGVKNGPPLAVKRHSLMQFPFSYTIGPANVMLEGNPFEGKMVITARLDFDGDARARSGDIQGAVIALPGDKNVDIKLDTVIRKGKDFIEGSIVLDPKLKDHLPKVWKLFVIARPEGMHRGPPLAVIRLDQGEFPYKFRLGQENVMMPGAIFEGNLTVTVRLDKDGDAKAGPGDIQGKKTVLVGDENVEIALDNLLAG